MQKEIGWAKVVKVARTLAERDPEMQARMRKSMAVAKPIIDDLAKLGYKVETLAELRHQNRDWKTALPVLLRWLPLIDDDLNVKQDIISCLSVPWIGNKATGELIEEFKTYAPTHSMVAWTIGNALSSVDVKGFEKQIIELCGNPKYGMARQMLVLSLGRLRKPQAEEMAVELLNDEEVKLHAIGALGTIKSKRALFELERLLTDKRAVIRKEARKAITKIMR